MSLTRLFLLSFFVFSSVTAQAAEQPNVVVILTDDQGWGDLSLHGNKNLATPRIDSIAHDGAMFDRFFVCPVCAPTRAEFMTGRYYPRTGVSGVSRGDERLNYDETTIADTFKTAGYRTGAFGKWHNGTQSPYHPNDRGFSEYYGFTSGHWGIYFDPPLDHNGQAVKGKGYITDDLTDHAIDFIKENREQPFFCYVAYNTPHSPMEVPDRFYKKFADDSSISMHHRDPKKEDMPHLRAALAMCENIDWNVGRILDTLEGEQLAENTIVVFFSDNGPNGWRWNGDMKGRKGTADEGGVRVPCLIRWPKVIPAGTKIPQIAAAIDLLPTLADLTNVPLTSKKPLDGKSLKPLLKDPQTSWKDRVIFSSYSKRASLRTQQYRFDGQLFDLTVDPGQRTNIADQQPELVNRFTDLLKQHRAMKKAHDKANQNRPFTVGFNAMTTLPARDGIPHGSVKRSTRAPNNSYFTQWTGIDGTITWEIEVAETGNYKATIYHTCAAENVGCNIEISATNGSASSTKVETAFDPPLRGKELDRTAGRGGESYVKDWKALEVGSIQISQGRGVLTIKATEIPGQGAIDVYSVVLEKE